MPLPSIGAVLYFGFDRCAKHLVVEREVEGLAVNRIVPFLLLLAACESPSSEELLANKACTPDGVCAAGYVCRTGTCVPEGSTTGGAGGIGAAGGTGGVGAAGLGGSGGSGGCSSASDCPLPSNECEVRVCLDGLCGTIDVPAETPSSQQVYGDCIARVCMGAGTAVVVVDDTDRPIDGFECTSDECNAGQPSNAPLPLGTPCTEGVCNEDSGCVACLLASDCFGTDTACQARTCEANVCGLEFSPAGTILMAQSVGDCVTRVCDGSGEATTIAADDPPSDQNQCTDDTCDGLLPVFDPVPSGSVCDGGTCDDNGQCEGCSVPADCGADGECFARSCTAGICGVTQHPQGTVLAQQFPGDCLERQCNGAGGVLQISISDPPPPDANDCTYSTCVGGAPSQAGLPIDTLCSAGVCDGSGLCVECNSAATCGASGACFTASCAANTCTEAAVANNTVAHPSVQVAANCSVALCDGAGGVVPTADPSDLPIDNNPCTQDSCAGGVPSNPSLPDGSSCGASGQCQSGTCNSVCGFDASPIGGSCPAACTGGCVANTCIVNCTAANACSGATIDCPEGFACKVECATNSSCVNAIVNCPSSHACDVDCTRGCAGLDLICGGGTCEIACGSMGNPCSGTVVDCGENSCHATCAGNSKPMLVNDGPSCDFLPCP